MTDNEIIKALECCCTLNGVGCRNCPQYDIHSAMCVKNLIRNTLDLINRQKAEIEGLNVELKSMRGAANSYKLENERLLQKLQQAKSEAIKEFAEELEYFVLNEDIEVAEPKCKDYESYINGANQFRHQIKNGINNLVKERRR